MSNRMVSRFVTGRHTAAGTTEEALVATTTKVSENGVRIIADPNNTGPVWVGVSGLTKNSADATDGYPLYAGRELVVPAGKASDIYLRFTLAGEKVWYLIG